MQTLLLSDDNSISITICDMGWLDLLMSDAMVMMAVDDCRG
jgi:hypothetical protein